MLNARLKNCQFLVKQSVDVDMTIWQVPWMRHNVTPPPPPPHTFEKS